MRPRPLFFGISWCDPRLGCEFSGLYGLQNESVMLTFVSTWGSRPRIFGRAKFLCMCATSASRPSEWTKGTSCLVIRCSDRCLADGLDPGAYASQAGELAGLLLSCMSLET